LFIAEAIVYVDRRAFFMFVLKKRRWPDISTLRRRANALSSKSPNRRWRRSRKAPSIPRLRPDLRVKAPKDGMTAFEPSCVGRLAAA
jgi:hypothetical protein